MFTKSKRFRPAVAILLAACCACFQLPVWAQATGDSSGSSQQSSGQGAVLLDLTSQNKTIAVGASDLGTAAQAAISAGGQQKTVRPGDVITPAEFVALTQVLSGATQTLIVDALGRAAGGTFSLSGLTSTQLAGLNIPSGVTALTQAGSAGLNITGTLSAQGLLVGLPGAGGAGVNIQAGLIQVGPGGSITTQIPQSLQALIGQIMSPVNLSLISFSDIVNHGTIAASGVLNLTAAGQIINQLPAGAPTGMASPTIAGVMGTNLFSGAGSILNSGTIASALGNVTFNTVSARDLVLNNIAGQIIANQGAVLMRDQSFVGNFVTEVLGGIIRGQSVQFFGGTGAVAALVDRIDGPLTVLGGTANVQVRTGTLDISQICLSGDPVFANSGGSVDLSTLGGLLTMHGQNLTILAANDILANGAASIDLSGDAGNPDGGNLHLVAGFDFTPTGETTFPDTTAFTFSGPSVRGGNVVLTGLSINTSSDFGNGGSVTIIATAGSDEASLAGQTGNIVLGPSIDTHSQGVTGTAGSVAILATNSISGAAVNLNLTCPDGRGGDLTMAAGAEIFPATGAQVFPNVEFDIVPGSLTGGAIWLLDSTIDLSGSTESNDASAGDLLAVAHDGFLATIACPTCVPCPNPGTIELGSISAFSSGGSGGDVTLIAQSGITVSGAIDLTGFDGGRVSIFGAEPTGSLIVTNGQPDTGEGAGFDIGDIPAPSILRPDIRLQNIDVSGFAFDAGRVNIQSTGSILVEGSISADGGSEGGFGGNVFIFSAESDITTGSISVNGGDDFSFGFGGDAGRITLQGAGGVTVQGDLRGRGGDGFDNGETGAGGAGAQVTLETATTGGVNTGPIVVEGIIRLRGGDLEGDDGSAGAGGSLEVNAATFRVFDSDVDGISIDVSGGQVNCSDCSASSGIDGTVTIRTFGAQPLTANFDLLNTDRTEFALPGGFFEVGNPLVNGTDGFIVSGDAQADNFNAGQVDETSPVVFNSSNGGVIDIAPSGTSFTIVEETAGVNNPVNISSWDSDSGRHVVTPGEALALFDVSRGFVQHVGLNDQGQVTGADPNPSFSFGPSHVDNINSYEIPRLFSAFNFDFIVSALAPAFSNGLNLTVLGLFPRLDLSGTDGDPVINGFISFDTAENRTIINLGERTLNVGFRGGFDGSFVGSILTISGSASDWFNTGFISADTVILHHPGADLVLHMSNDPFEDEEGRGGDLSGLIIVSGAGANISILGGDSGSAVYTTDCCREPPVRSLTIDTHGLTVSNLKATDFITLKALGESETGANLRVLEQSIITAGTDITFLSDDFGDPGEITFEGDNIVHTDTGSIFMGIPSLPASTIEVGSDSSNSAFTAPLGSISANASEFIDDGDDTYDAISINISTFTSSGSGGIEIADGTTMHATDSITLEARLNPGDTFTSIDIGSDVHFLADSGTITAQSDNGFFTGSDTTFIAATGITIDGGSGLTDLGSSNQVVSTSGDIDIYGNIITISSGALIQTGVLAGTASAEDALSPAEILSAGNIEIETGGVPAVLNIQSNTENQTTIRATGGDVFIYADGMDLLLGLGGGLLVEANGGNVFALSAQHVFGGGFGNTFRARSVGTQDNFTGGGIEIGAGVDDLGKITHIGDYFTNRGFGLIVPNVDDLGGGALIDNNGFDLGLVQINLDGFVSIGNSNISLRRGAVIFDAFGPFNVQMNSPLFFAASFDLPVPPTLTTTPGLPAAGGGGVFTGTPPQEFGPNPIIIQTEKTPPPEEIPPLPPIPDIQLVEETQGQIVICRTCSTFEVSYARDTFVQGQIGTTFEVAHDKTILLKEGRMFAGAGKDGLKLETGSEQVELQPYTIAVIDARANMPVRVTVLDGKGDSAAVVKTSGNPVANLGTGQEAILADHELTDEELIPVDGVERQYVGGAVYKQGRAVRAASVAVDQLLEKEPLMRCCFSQKIKDKDKTSDAQKIVCRTAWPFQRLQDRYGQGRTASSGESPQGNLKEKKPPLGPVSHGEVWQRWLDATDAGLDSRRSAGLVPVSYVQPETASAARSVSGNPLIVNRNTRSGVYHWDMEGDLTLVAALPPPTAPRGFHLDGSAQLTEIAHGHYRLVSGSVLLQPEEPIRIDTPNGSVLADTHTALLVTIEDNLTRVLDLADWGTDDVRALVGTQYVSLGPGREVALLSGAAYDPKRLVAADGLGRRRMRVIPAGGERQIVINDFSMVDAMLKIPMLRELRNSRHRADRGLLADILKTAAAVSLTTGRMGGPYSSAESP